jgi:hypothetical protein
MEKDSYHRRGPVQHGRDTRKFARDHETKGQIQGTFLTSFEHEQRANDWNSFIYTLTKLTRLAQLAPTGAV